MTTPRDLVLSSEQLAVVLDAVPPAWRRRFLDDVADRLVGRDITNDEVQHAVARALTCFDAGAA